MDKEKPDASNNVFKNYILKNDSILKCGEGGGLSYFSYSQISISWDLLNRNSNFRC